MSDNPSPQPLSPVPEEQRPQEGTGSPSITEIPSPAPRRKTSWALAFVFLCAIGALLAFFVIRLFFSAPGAVVDKSLEIAEKVKESVMEITNIQPRVVVNSKVHYEQSSSILELAITTRQTLVEREMDHTWLGSTKRIKLRGVYVVKSGFDLSRPFSIVVEGTRAIVRLPPARILSSEPRNVEVLELNNGLWNKINPDDLELELNTLNLMAREKMLQESINQEAEKAVVEKLRERLGPDVELDVRIGPDQSLPVLQG